MTMRDRVRVHGFVVMVLMCALLLCLLAVGTAGAYDRNAFAGETIRLLLKEGYEIDVITKFKSDFEKQTGIKVEIEIYDEPTTRQKFIFDATSKSGVYDITSVQHWYLPEYFRNGWLEPLNRYLKDHPDPWLDMRSIPKAAVDTLSVGDELYAMPHTVIAGALHYRKDIFEKHKIPVPKTTDDVIKAAETLKRVEPNMYAIVGRGAPNFASFGTYAGWAYGYGAKLLDEQYRPHVNSPEMVKAVEDYVRLLKEFGPPGQASLTWIQMGQSFQEGKVAMMFDTTGWGALLNNPDQSKVAGKVGHTLVTGPAGNYIQWMYIEGLGISKFSKHKGAAWLFLQWRMSQETTKKEVEELYRWDVPNLSIIQSDGYKQLAKKAHADQYAELLPKAWAAADKRYWPYVPEFVEIADAFMVEVSSAIEGKQTVKQALDKAQTKIDKILRQAGYYR